MRFALVLLIVGFCVMLHAFFPNVCRDTGSRAVKAMYNALEDRDEG